MAKPDRLSADEDGAVYACPECDKAGCVYRRHHHNTHIGDPDDPYACGECSATFEEPNKRQPKKGSGGGRPSKLEKMLERDETDLTRTTITSPYGLDIVQAAEDWGFGARRAGDYERDVIEWFRERPGDVFLDVGARTGWHGLHASLVGYTPHFVEPAAVVGLLYSSLRANAIAGVVYPVAASDTDGTLDMVDAREEFYQPDGDGEAVSVPCARVDTLIPAFGGRTVAAKVDVEGHELAVLRGFGDLLSDVDYLVVEHHPGHTDTEATMTYLRERGFTEARLQERNQLLGYYER